MTSEHNGQKTARKETEGGSEGMGGDAGDGAAQQKQRGFETPAIGAAAAGVHDMPRSE
jgi:hypothetical protein